MTIAEFFHVLWRRKVGFFASALVVVGLAAGSLSLQTRMYESAATIGLTPMAGPDGTINDTAFFLLGRIEIIGPLYAEAITAGDTRELARTKVPDGRIGSVSVATYRDAPLIVRISVRSPVPLVARNSAQAHVEALTERAERGEVGFPGLIDILVVNRPSVPTEPVSPQPRLTLMVGVVLGLGVGVGTSFLRENLARKVETAEALSEIVGAPVFGEIPAERAVARLRTPGDLSTEPRLRTVAEAFRDLRTNLQFGSGEFRSILVTSPEGRHGKTTVAFGLAATIARTGARTLLIDGDLRRGRLMNLLGIPPMPGLYEALNGLPPEDAVVAVTEDGLFAMPSGNVDGDPTEALEATFFQVLFQLERDFDVVVIDGTPLLPVNDARIMARLANCTLLVASAGAVTRRQVRAAAERMRIIGVDPTAVVLNNSRTRHKSGYYSYLEPVSAPRQPPASRPSA